MNRKLHVLIADDHAIIRLGIRQALLHEFDADFAEAGDARETLELARTTPFDLVLLDITMPGRSGLDVLTELKTALPNAPVLVVSMHAEEQYAMRAIRQGAAGYITKSQLAGELVAAVRKVLDGRRYISEALGERMAATIAGDSGTAGVEELSTREFEVLRLIATGRSGKEIAADLSISYKTVSTYRTRILQKLNLRTNHELVEFARREKLTEESSL
jgi:two-component system, NarL family, invasion response regulator UvrY